MADVVTFDFLARRIVEISTGGDNEIDVVEVYSEWKQALLDDPALLGYPQAFRQVGGDPISGTQSLGTTYFLLNGWRIRPAESHHKLTLVGNIFTEPAGASVFVPTIGAFTVNTETRVSNLIDAVSRPSELTATVDAVLNEPMAAHLTDGTVGDALAKLYAMLGLDPTKPLTVTSTRRFVGDPGSPDIDQSIAENAGIVTVTRQ